VTRGHSEATHTAVRAQVSRTVVHSESSVAASGGTATSEVTS
jgi:hypothetical protein